MGYILCDHICSSLVILLFHQLDPGILSPDYDIEVWHISTCCSLACLLSASRIPFHKLIFYNSDCFVKASLHQTHSQTVLARRKIIIKHVGNTWKWPTIATKCRKYDTTASLHNLRQVHLVFIQTLSSCYNIQNVKRRCSSRLQSIFEKFKPGIWITDVFWKKEINTLLEHVLSINHAR